MHARAIEMQASMPRRYPRIEGGENATESQMRLGPIDIKTMRKAENHGYDIGKYCAEAIRRMQDLDEWLEFVPNDCLDIPIEELRGGSGDCSLRSIHEWLYVIQKPILEICQEAAAKIESLGFNFEGIAVQAKEVALADMYWYANYKGDFLTRFELNDMRKLFSTYPPRDPKHFADFTYENFMKCLRAPRRRLYDERNWDRPMELVRTLGRLEDQSAKRLAFHLIIKLTSELPLDTSCRDKNEGQVALNENEWQSLYGELDEQLRTYLDEDVKATDRHWDLTGAWNKLHDIFQRTKCEKKSCDAGEFSGASTDRSRCIHYRMINARIVIDLLVATHKEVRENVMLATGHKLPTELMDLVFEATLEVSGIPQSLDPFGEHMHHLKWDPQTSSHGNVRLFEPYRCPRIRIVAEGVIAPRNADGSLQLIGKSDPEDKSEYVYKEKP